MDPEVFEPGSIWDSKDGSRSIVLQSYDGVRFHTYRGVESGRVSRIERSGLKRKYIPRRVQAADQIPTKAAAMAQKRTLRVKQVEADYFEVSEGDKLWTLARTGHSGWFITNRRGQVVSSAGPTGMRLIQAVLDRPMRKPGQVTTDNTGQEGMNASEGDVATPHSTPTAPLNNGELDAGTDSMLSTLDSYIKALDEAEKRFVNAAATGDQDNENDAADDLAALVRQFVNYCNNWPPPSSANNETMRHKS